LSACLAHPLSLVAPAVIMPWNTGKATFCHGARTLEL
jgi:hypothetical protein